MLEALRHGADWLVIATGFTKVCSNFKARIVGSLAKLQKCESSFDTYRLDKTQIGAAKSTRNSPISSISTPLETVEVAVLVCCCYSSSRA
jgi:hypothetical protein